MHLPSQPDPRFRSPQSITPRHLCVPGVHDPHCTGANWVYPPRTFPADVFPSLLLLLESAPPLLLLVLPLVLVSATPPTAYLFLLLQQQIVSHLIFLQFLFSLGCSLLSRSLVLNCFSFPHTILVCLYLRVYSGVDSPRCCDPR